MSPAFRFWALALGAGLLSGAFYLAVAYRPFASMPLLYFAQFPLFVAGLAGGATASLVAGIAAGSLVMTHEFGIALSLLFGAVFIVPVPILVRQALLARTGSLGGVEWYPPGLLTGWLVGIGLALLGLGSVVIGLQGGIEAYARQSAGFTVDLLGQMIQQPPSPGERARAVDRLSAHLLGAAVAVVMVVTVINATLAQGLLMRFGWNRRPAPDMAALDLPPHVPLLALGCLAAGMLLPGDLGYVLRNALPVLLAGGLLAGLAVAHAAMRRLNGRSWMLALLYMVAIFMGLPMFLLMAIGMAEPFLKLKRRMLAAA
ncbi:MAG: DUF2232 domain-containing protein [Alphaproteobacteria bacterium]|nr:DUF2232 domain-containing protein [Alphaproteobacteria bacterium]